MNLRMVSLLGTLDSDTTFAKSKEEGSDAFNTKDSSFYSSVVRVAIRYP